MSDTSRTADPRAAQRARYDELYRQGKARRRDFAEAKGNPASLPDAAVLRRETLPGGWGWSGLVRCGETLRIVNRTATQGVSLLLYRAADPSERLNVGDTVKIQWSARLHKGKLLYSDMGRVLASLTDDTFGHHDAIAGGSTAFSNARKYGDAMVRDTRSNFILLAAKHGLSKADIAPCLTLFAPVAVDSAGKLVWAAATPAPGDYVDLRAEMDLLVFASNAPHPLAPGTAEPEAVDLVIWRSPPPDAEDFCRTASEEARRGFDNTDILPK